MKIRSKPHGLTVQLSPQSHTCFTACDVRPTFDRLVIGFGESERLLSRMFPPDFSRTNLLLSGLAESLQIAIISEFSGIVISLFLGLLAARNMMPSDCIDTHSWLHRACASLFFTLWLSQSHLWKRWALVLWRGSWLWYLHPLVSSPSEL